MGCHLIDIPFRALGLKYPTAVECSVGSVYRQMWTPEHLPEGCPPSSFVTIILMRLRSITHLFASNGRMEEFVLRIPI